MALTRPMLLATAANGLQLLASLAPPEDDDVRRSFLSVAEVYAQQAGEVPPPRVVPPPRDGRDGRGPHLRLVEPEEAR